MCRIENENVHGKLKVVTTEDKMGENHLKWFGHVHMILIDVVRRIDCLEVTCTSRGCGRFKRIW